MLATAALIALLLSACAATSDGTTTTAGGQRMVPVSIEQVLTLDSETPVFVKGTLFADADGVRLCEAIGESFPVQCLGDQITITDIDLYPEYAGLLVGDGDVKTSDGEVNIVGFYSNGNLRVDPAAAGADAS
jgi:hypothetical protein